MIACAHGKVTLVRGLLQMGASPQLPDQEGKTAVDYAVHNHHYNVEHILNEYSKYDLIFCAKLLILGKSSKPVYCVQNDWRR